MTARIAAAARLLARGLPVALLGCASAGGPQASPPGAFERGPIVVGPHSNVCVSVHVDQRIWPRPLDAEVPRAFSGGIMVGLRRIFEQRGGSLHIPGTHNEPRFVTNVRGTSPDCRERDSDVFVEMRYGPRADGKPFIVKYWISRGPHVRFGEFDVNVAEEIRAGRIVGYSIYRTDAAIIGEDIMKRAPIIADQLTIQPR